MYQLPSCGSLHPHLKMPDFPSQIYIKTAPKNAGNGLFASQDIDPGQEIFRIEQPLLSVLDSPHLRDACANCYTWCPPSGVGQFGEEKGVGVTLKACLGCKINRYCSKVGLIGSCLCYSLCFERQQWAEGVIRCIKPLISMPGCVYFSFKMCCIYR